MLRFNLGTSLEIPLDDKWFISSGPYYSGKGVIMSQSSSTGQIDSFRIHLNYIELPMEVGYRFADGAEKTMGFLFGPYLGYGFNGKITTRNSNSVSEHLHRKDHSYKRFDFGLDASFFYELNAQYGLRVGCSRSLINIRRDKDDHQRNLVFGVSFFAFFNKNQ
jgi:hypothetical protein